jgi:hypothetical protein
LTLFFGVSFLLLGWFFSLFVAFMEIVIVDIDIVLVKDPADSRTITDLFFVLVFLLLLVSLLLLLLL